MMKLNHVENGGGDVMDLVEINLLIMVMSNVR